MHYSKGINHLYRVISLLLFVSTISLAQPKPKKISEEEAGISLIQKGQDFLDDFYSKMKTEGVYDFSAIGTEMVIKTFTPEYMKTQWDVITPMTGEYESASFKESWVTDVAPDMKILRYMGKYSKGVPFELRVVFDKNEKLAGLIIIPWKDQL